MGGSSTRMHRSGRIVPAVSPGAADASEQALAAAVLLAGGLPVEAQEHLTAAGLAYADSPRAEDHLARADAIAPDHPAVLIARYRYLFYKGRRSEAREVAERCLTAALDMTGLGSDWRALSPDDAAFGAWDAVLPRFLLFSLKGYAYLSMRLGELDVAEEAVAKLLELDPADRIGAKVLADVAARAGREDDDDE
ncbi:tetratricopeptide repeat protein [Acuticoccus sediminis]|uniref:hypothetical protein n=1 Tax=Acuticoccus sediminis TaxID=2184697 RepID=UPI001CFEDE1B|nr:hypothetical protein [Acuticoccus sediminis]